MNKRYLFLGLLVFLIQACTTTSKTFKDNLAPDWAMGAFERPEGVNPIIEPDSTTSFYDPMSKTQVKWEESDTFNPAAVVKDGKIVVLYRAEDHSGIGIGKRTSRIGYAESEDGIHFERRKEPVFFPADDDQKEYEWPGGVEDPRVAMTADGLYVMFYTQWNRKVPRLGVATSNDLITWKKHGPIFKNASHGEIFNKPHKSASIVTKLEDGKQVIAKINGKYWMYWGELGVYAAISDNLVDWEPIVDENNEPVALIEPRPGYFDSQLTECGPPAIITDGGILLLYNGKNHKEKGDDRFNKGTYSAGQVLFSIDDPTKMLQRLDVPFLRPMESFEKSGQYVDGTVFIEGLVFFKDKWFLYYGSADSKVSVAVYDPANPGQFDPLP